jgi:hypothetical protein
MTHLPHRQPSHYTLTFDPDQAVRVRIQAEFREMPGMRLTVPQAARLFNLDSATCQRALRELVQTGILATNGRQFFRHGTGRYSG